MSVISRIEGRGVDVRAEAVQVSAVLGRVGGEPRGLFGLLGRGPHHARRRAVEIRAVVAVDGRGHPQSNEVLLPRSEGGVVHLEVLPLGPLARERVVGHGLEEFGDLPQGRDDVALDV
jgi:hypothetical protein